ncbi:hypothetical protein [Geobacillus sp. C56-T3]|uniref:hypothetical protein n=1 Tax=Geobacillus sp. (strain C56-T3) TaxID=691437 RepID=UPI0001D584F5|nr:hypothetical protein [Geobacillus sp. C56-T3]ADI26808.1 hypothetical protein GC56T3_1814 [Geobacillus sp. C56-T3]
MGTYYGLGIIKEFVARSEKSFTWSEWEQILTKRIDLCLFRLAAAEQRLSGSLYPEVFTENIHHFFQILRDIVGSERREPIDYYEKEFGSHLDNYPTAETFFLIEGPSGSPIIVEVRFAVLFIEGKVSVETFDAEPLLINWLFRNSPIKNKLAGCVISAII